jgi:hypothetical protein
LKLRAGVTLNAALVMCTLTCLEKKMYVINQNKDLLAPALELSCLGFKVGKSLLLASLLLLSDAF